MNKKTFIGIDLHSSNFNICQINSDGTKIRDKFSLDGPEDVLNFAKKLPKNAYLMVESSTNTFAFADIVKPYVEDILVANPNKLKLIGMVKKKTDKVDAEKLAVILKMQITTGEKLFDPVYIPEQKVRDLRSLFTTYKLLLKQKNAVKNRIRSVYRQQLKTLSERLTLTKPSIERLKTIEIDELQRIQVDILIESYLNLSKSIKDIQDRIFIAGSYCIEQVNVLTSMRGISILTALALIADIGEISRFSSSKKLCSYLRSAPGIDSSNETTRILSTNKQSRKLAISFVVQALAHFKTTNPKIKSWTEKKDGKKGKGKIRMAVCRKVITEIYQMLTKNQYHWFRDPKNHNFKMHTYLTFLKKHGIDIDFSKAA